MGWFGRGRLEEVFGVERLGGRVVNVRALAPHPRAPALSPRHGRA